MTTQEFLFGPTAGPPARAAIPVRRVWARLWWMIRLHVAEANHLPRWAAGPPPQPYRFPFGHL